MQILRFLRELITNIFSPTRFNRAVIHNERGESAGQIIGAVVGVGLFIATGGLSAGFTFAAIGMGLGAASLGASIGGLIDPPSVAKPNFGSIGSAIGSPRYGFDKLASTASPDLPIPIFYGHLKLAGNIIYQSEELETSTAPNPGDPPPITSSGDWFGGAIQGAIAYSLWQDQVNAFNASGGTRTEITRCIAVCEGEIEGIYDVRINEDPITDFPNCSYDVYTGTSDQVVDSRFTGAIDGLRYTAYLALTLSTSDKLTSSPSVTFNAFGKKIKTWNGSEWSTTKVWSDNPAACIRDILTSKQYGVGLPEASLDDDSFGEVYEYCNGMVTSFNDTQEKRATLNYIIDARRNILDVLNDILSTFGGYMILNDSRIKLRVEKADDVTQAFNMSNIVKGSFSYAYLNRNERPNRVKVQYVDPDYNYTKVLAIADDPNDQDERRAMGVGEDVIEKELALLGVTRSNQASRMAEFMLNLSKISNIVTTFSCGISSLSAEIGDVVSVSHDVTGWTNKPFRILSIQEKSDDTMTLLAREYNASIYSDNPGQNIVFQFWGDVPSSINTPNPPRNFNVSQNGSTVVFTWLKPIPKFEVIIDHYEIREGTNWGSGNIISNDIGDSPLNLTSFTTGSKTYIIKAVSAAGIYSSGVTDSISIGIPSGFNAIIEYNELFETRFELGISYSDGIEVIRTTDRDPNYYFRAYHVVTDRKWDEHNWDTYMWDTPSITENQTIIIGENDEIDLLTNTTASVALGTGYYLGNDTDVQSYTQEIEIATRNSDGAWSDWSPFVTGFSIVDTRYIKFRFTIGTNDSEDEIGIFTIDTRIDVADKIERDNDVLVPIGGLVVTYVVEFLSKVAVTVTTVGTTAYIPRTTDKSLDGFTVFLETSAGSPISGNIDWIASGY